ncbi:glutathione-disulfide reductase [Luteimonas sp. MJ293]|uniref:glutathione-disulfide reductase n=1 Tax=Luteimonas sp. MJ146 TaxID=3129240 RepID=UPI0031BBC6CD
MNDKSGFDYDLIVVGGGSGGLAGAFRAAEHGARVALLEPADLGGTCVNLGCVPKKAMWLAADLAAKIDVAARLGFNVPTSAELDWREFLVDRQRYISGIHESYRRRLDEAGVSLVPHRGVLVDAHVVEAGGVQLRAPHVLLATGSHPVRPQVPGAEHGGVSDDFFDWDRAPERVALFGGGYISVELAGMLQALGTRADVFARGGRLLKQMDAEVVEQLQGNYRHLGVGLHLDYDLQELQRGDDGRLVLVDTSGAASGPYDEVVFAIGRKPSTAGIGLEQAGVALGEKGEVQVDDYQNTSAPGIYAVGDVTGQLTLTPVAIAAARRLMDRVFGGRPDSKLDYNDVPFVVFSHPPLGGIGLTEKQAREQHGDAVQVYRSSFRPMLQALADRPLRSLFKLVCVGEEQRVVGIHAFGEAADEILQGFAVALKRGVTLDDLHDTMAIHPTSAEEFVLMR